MLRNEQAGLIVLANARKRVHGGMKFNINATLRWRVLIRRAGLLVLFYLLLPNSAPRAQQGSHPEPKRILLLHHYGWVTPGVVLFDRGFEGVIKLQPPGSIETYRETLETYRLPSDDHTLLVHNYLKQKYAAVKIDTIVVYTDTALDFLLRYRTELFPDVPLVYVVSRRPNPEPPLSTGIWTGPNAKDTLEVGLQLQPNTQQVFLISSGPTNDNQMVELETHEQLQAFESRVKLNYLTNLPLDEVIAKVKSLPERSIVLYQRQTRGVAGQGVAPADAAALVGQAANAPVFVTSDHWIVDGIVGGKVTSQEAMGAEAAQIALRIVNGTSPQKIAVRTAELIPIFNWRQLQRWGISESKLPPGSVVRFKELTFWEQYKWIVAGGLALCVVEGLLITGLLVDRRKLKQTGLDLQNTRNDLAHLARVSAMGEMAASIAHEVNQPLSAIATYGDACVRLLSSEAPDVKRSLEAINHIISDSMRASEVIKRIRALIRKTVPENTPQDLNQIIMEIVAMTEGDIHSKSVVVILNLASDLPVVLGDRVELQQVVLNLILNGAEAMSANRDRARELKISSSQDGAHQIVVSVEDSGVGLNPAQTRSIFEPFVTTKPDGLGLGLAISRTILEAHGGKLWAESNNTSGARFQFTLPPAGASRNGN
jgi:signal transduction histidine kinase